MAEVITKGAFFEINFSDGKSPSFLILSSCNALLVLNLVTQGGTSVENVLKLGYPTYPEKLFCSLSITLKQPKLTLQLHHK